MVPLLMDRHKSHTSVGLVEWARNRNIIMSILPAHMGHILHPLDAGYYMYGLMQKMCNSECHKFIRGSHCVVTRGNICHPVCKVYNKVMSAESLIAALNKNW
jgi:hypothetical protein